MTPIDHTLQRKELNEAVSVTYGGR
jgi:hypothetical protein